MQEEENIKGIKKKAIDRKKGILKLTESAVVNEWGEK